MTVVAGESPGRPVDVIRIWCIERQSGSECAVYAKRYSDCLVQPGDSVTATPRDRRAKNSTGAQNRVASRT